MTQEQDSIRKIDIENQRGILALAELIALNGGKLIKEDWGFMVKPSSMCENIGFSFVFIGKKIDEKELSRIINKADKFFEKKSYEIWLENLNASLTNLFEKLGLSEIGHFPARSLRLQQDFDEGTIGNEITTKRVETEDDIRNWIKVTSEVYAIDPEKLEAFFKSASHQKNTFFYIAYHKEIPVSTRMMIMYGSTVTGYLSSTLSKYRKRGIASMLMRFSLNEARRKGATLFVNQAASNGKSLIWKKMGMVEYGNVYSCYLKKGKKLVP